MIENVAFLILPCLSALCATLAVWCKPTPALHARRWLTLSMLCAALSALLLMHYYIPSLRLSIMLDFVFEGTLLCLAPCFFMTILSLTSLSGIQRKHYLIFLPGALYMLLLALLNILMGPAESLDALEEIVLRLHPLSTNHSIAFRLYEFFGHTFFRSYAALSLIAVFVWGAWAIKQYRQQLDDYLTEVSHSLIIGTHLIYLSFILFSLFGLSFAACEYAQTFTPWLLPTFSIAIAISLALMGYFARQVQYSAEQLIQMEKAAAIPPIQSPLHARLTIIEKDMLYHDPNLTIFTLARIIGTNRTYLTRAFRECYGESFSEHINRLRIEEAIRLMTESPQLPLHDIASRVGYNSPTSLYRNFIRIYHCSPTDYLSRQKNKGY